MKYMFNFSEYFRQKKNIRYAEHGQVLRHVVLKGISAQILSAAVSMAGSIVQYNSFNAPNTNALALIH